jgi:hypothetical protein
MLGFLIKFILDLVLLDTSELHVSQKRLTVLTTFNRKRSLRRKRIQHKFIAERLLGMIIRAHYIDIMSTTLLTR